MMRTVDYEFSSVTFTLWDWDENANEVKSSNGKILAKRIYKFYDDTSNICKGISYFGFAISNWYDTTKV